MRGEPCPCPQQTPSFGQEAHAGCSHLLPGFVPPPTPFQGVLNFVQYKFSHLAPRERQTMFELSKMFLLCLNYWKLETPAQFRQRSQAEDVATYKVNYTR